MLRASPSQMELTPRKYYNLKLSLAHSENTSSETIFVNRVEVNDNAFRSIWLLIQIVGLKPDSVRSPFCHVGGREFKSRTSRHELPGQQVFCLLTFSPSCARIANRAHSGHIRPRQADSKGADD